MKLITTLIKFRSSSRLAIHFNAGRMTIQTIKFGSNSGLEKSNWMQSVTVVRILWCVFCYEQHCAINDLQIVINRPNTISVTSSADILPISTNITQLCRDGPETETSRHRDYPWSRLGATSKCLGLETWRLGLDFDLSGLEPIAIFTQIYLWRFVIKTLSPHKLNWSVNNNPCRLQQISTICTSSLWHMTSFVPA